MNKLYNLLVSLGMISFCLSNVSNAAPGDLDYSFGTDGFVKTQFTPTISDLGEATFQPDGKYVVVGSVGQAASNDDFYVLRFNADGTPDVTFGNNGAAIIVISDRADVASSVDIQADGKILIGGVSRSPSFEFDYAVVRLNADGSLDTSFGDKGIVITAPSNAFDFCHSIKALSNGKVLVGGQSQGTTGQLFTLIQYNADGSLDKTFGTDGTTKTQFPDGVSAIEDLIIQPDGKIVAAGTAGQGDFTLTNFGFARYDANGVIDTTFGNNGIQTVDVRVGPAEQNTVEKLALQPDGKILAVGTTNSSFESGFDFGMTRLNSDGSIDTTFGDDGKVIVPLFEDGDDTAREILLQPDGKILIAGMAEVQFNDRDFALLRFNSDGSLDTKFGNGGIRIAPRSQNGEGINNLRITEDGKIFAAGFSGFEITLAVFRTNGIREFDFDGDNKADVSIFRPSVGEWWYLRSTDLGNQAFQFGQSTDKPIPADYTGDGKTDIAFFRPDTSEWFVLRSEDDSFYSFPFGTTGDIPAPGDYDGDGITDTAVFRPSETNWYILKTSGGTDIIQFGTSEDKPVVADYDGDGKDDLAVFRPSVSEWWINQSTDGVTALQFGSTGDKTVQGDYTGDGKADVAFYRPTTSEWFVVRSEDLSFFSFPFGASGDVATPGDYDGDGRFDAAVFRPTETTWYINGTQDGVQIVGFGFSDDIPVPSVYSVP